MDEPKAKRSKRTHASAAPLSLTEELPMVDEPADADSSLKIRIRLPKHMEKNGSVPNPVSSLLLGSNVASGVEISAVVAYCIYETGKGVKKTDYCRMSLTSLNSVLVPFYVSKNEKETLQKKHQFTEAMIAEYQQKREPLPVPKGKGLTLTFFHSADKHLPRVEIGSHVVLPNLRFRVEVNPKGVPVISFQSDIKVKERRPPLHKLAQLISGLPFPSIEELKQASDELITYGVPKKNAKGGGSGGAADTFVMTSTGGEGGGEEGTVLSYDDMEISTPPSSDPTVRNTNTALISTKQLYAQTPYRKLYLWYLMDNTLAADTTETLSGTGAGMPLLTVANIPQDNIEGSINSNFIRKPGGGDDLIPCIREKKALLGCFAVIENQLQAFMNMPIYVSAPFYEVANPVTWPLFAAHLFRNTKAIICLDCNPTESLSALEQILQEDPSRKIAYSGYPNLLIDFVHTFQHAGLRVSHSFAMEWIRKFVEGTTSKAGTFMVKSPVNADSKLATQLATQSAGDVNLVYVNDVPGLDPTNLEESDWIFVIVPPASLLSQMLEDPAAEMQKFYSMNAAASGDSFAGNEAYITQNWASNMFLAKKTGVFAIRESVVSSTLNYSAICPPL